MELPRGAGLERETRVDWRQVTERGAPSRPSSSYFEPRESASFLWKPEVLVGPAGFDDGPDTGAGGRERSRGRCGREGGRDGGDRGGGRGGGGEEGKGCRSAARKGEGVVVGGRSDSDNGGGGGGGGARGASRRGVVRVVARQVAVERSPGQGRAPAGGPGPRPVPPVLLQVVGPLVHPRRGRRPDPSRDPCADAPAQPPAADGPGGGACGARGKAPPCHRCAGGAGARARTLLWLRPAARRATRGADTGANVPEARTLAPLGRQGSARAGGSPRRAGPQGSGLPSADPPVSGSPSLTRVARPWRSPVARHLSAGPNRPGSKAQGCFDLESGHAR